MGSCPCPPPWHLSPERAQGGGGSHTAGVRRLGEGGRRKRRELIKGEGAQRQRGSGRVRVWAQNNPSNSNNNNGIIQAFESRADKGVPMLEGASIPVQLADTPTAPSQLPLITPPISSRPWMTATAQASCYHGVPSMGDSAHASMDPLPQLLWPDSQALDPGLRISCVTLGEPLPTPRAGMLSDMVVQEKHP